MHTKIKQYFQLHDLPFEQTPNLKYFCDFESYRDALAAVVYSVAKGEPIIKVIGEVGTGKTLLCRKLIDVLDEQGVVTLYIHNPLLNTDTLFRLIADELKIKHDASDAEYHLYKKITDALLAYHDLDKKVVLLVDEAQTLSDSALEALRLLTNLESESRKLIQIIFLAQPELDERLRLKKFRQLKQRIGFHFTLSALQEHQIEQYLKKRLISAGHTTGDVFSSSASRLLFRESAGIPRIINIIAYKALLASYVQGKFTVDHDVMRAAVSDAKDVIASNVNKRKRIHVHDVILASLVVGAILVVCLFYLLVR